MMKKLKVLFLIFMLVSLFNIKAFAVTIQTNNTSGTVDTNSKKVTNEGTLTITGVQNNDTFRAYKMLDMFYNSTSNTITYEFTSSFKAYLQSTSGQDPDYSYLTVNDYEALTSGNIENGSTQTDSSLDTLISGYAGYIKQNGVSGTNMNVANNTATASLPAGAYLVLPTATTKVYAVMAGNVEFEAGPNNTWAQRSTTIVAKVSDASVTKVFEINDDTEATFNIGEDHTYKIVATLPTYPTNATNESVAIIDIVDNTIDYKGLDTVVIKDGNTILSIGQGGVIKRGGTTVGSIALNGRQMTISLDADKLLTNVVTVEYDGVLNQDAILGPDCNHTEVELTYALDPYGTDTATTSVTTTAYTYGIKIAKVDNNGDPVQGATFKIFSDLGLNQEVGTITSDINGYATYKGVREGTYYVKEITAPSGYRIDNTVHNVVIDTTKEYTEIEIENEKMGLLPATGGIGSLIYISLGTILIIASIFTFIIIFKKKKEEKE